MAQIRLVDRILWVVAVIVIIGMALVITQNWAWYWKILSGAVGLLAYNRRSLVAMLIGVGTSGLGDLFELSPGGIMLGFFTGLLVASVIVLVIGIIQAFL
jgi:hypothetical protein